MADETWVTECVRLVECIGDYRPETGETTVGATPKELVLTIVAEYERTRPPREWAEVTITEVLRERDRARALAVRLEQELAEAELAWLREPS